jgi:hypothetical protein
MRNSSYNMDQRQALKEARAIAAKLRGKARNAEPVAKELNRVNTRNRYREKHGIPLDAPSRNGKPLIPVEPIK